MALQLQSFAFGIYSDDHRCVIRVGFFLFCLFICFKLLQ